MSLQFFLIDFENVQPRSLGALKPGTCRIKLFLGENQSKVTVELSRALQPFGTDVEFVQITGNGPNAVDFHIAFYLGRLAQLHPGASFVIVSRDTGFDPLVRHLAGLKIACKRIAEMEGALKPSPKIAVAAPTTPPAAKKAVAAKAKPKNVSVTILPGPNGKPAAQPKAAAASANHVTVVVARLVGMKAARPAKLATLQSSLKSWFKPALTEKQLADVIEALTESKKVRLDGTKVTYALS
ncbi:MAG: PIN domain-containing protein [Pseudomonadota bacterium]|nr:PIN domain-containing protein [Pseudomonadota bacterium]